MSFSAHLVPETVRVRSGSLEGPKLQGSEPKRLPGVHVNPDPTPNAGADLDPIPNLDLTPTVVHGGHKIEKKN